MGAFCLEKSDGFAVITFDVPGQPVNMFSVAVRDVSFRQGCVEG